MKKLLLGLIAALPLTLMAQTYDFDSSGSTVWDGVQSTVTFTSNAIRLDYTAGQQPKLRTVAPAGVDASANKVLAITFVDRSPEIETIKVKHDKKATGGNRFVSFELPLVASQGNTFYLDVQNAEWDNNGASGVVQDNLDIAFRASNDNPLVNAGFVEIDRIEFVPSIPVIIRNTYSFQTDGNTEGYEGKSGSSAVASSGLLTWSFSSGVPRLEQSVYAVNDGSVTFMHITMKNNTAYDELRLSIPNPAGSPSNFFVDAPISENDGAFVTYNIDLTQFNGWGTYGDIQFLDIRVRDQNAPSQGGNGTIEIEEIAFDNSPTASVEGTQNIDFTIAPNPATSFFEVQSSNLEIQNINIYGITGKLVQTISEPSSRVNVSSLDSGIYIVQITANNGTSSTKKLILK